MMYDLTNRRLVTDHNVIPTYKCCCPLPWQTLPHMMLSHADAVISSSGKMIPAQDILCREKMDLMNFF